MAINARTFQLLYITRQRALKDLPTKVKDMSTFINKRRKANPSMYEKAYLAPASIRDMVQRMTTGEGLLTIADEGNLELTVRGSQMADLLSEIDACSTFFHADWKKHICKAVLKQRFRLGQGPITPREAAVIANISLDSARRGLAAVAQEGEAVEDRAGRTPLYELLFGEETGGEPGVLPTPVAEAAKEFQNPCLEIPLGPMSMNELPHPEDEAYDPVRDALSSINEDEDILPGETDLQPQLPDEMEKLPLGLILGDDKEDDEDTRLLDETRLRTRLFMSDALPEDNTEGTEEDEASPVNKGWDSVSHKVKAALLEQASACGMTPDEFFRTLAEANARRMSVALRHTINYG